MSTTNTVVDLATTSRAGKAAAASPARGARRRWPLLLIGASAGTATWSGWVGLGQLTGFGVVHPLPGIADAVTINTAVTLPIGVEAYAMYALSIATSSRQLPARTRRYAWASSGAALLLGMAGQVAYHVMTARGPIADPVGDRLAPWWVIAVVSCLPVLVLGAASLLWHLAADADPGTGPTAQTAAAEIGRAEAIRPEVADDPIPPTTSAPSPSGRSPKPTPAAKPTTTRTVEAREQDLARAREAIAAGQLAERPTASALRTLLAISPAYARATRDALAIEQQHPPAPNHTGSAEPKPAVPKRRSQEEHPEHDEEMTEPLFQQPNPDPFPSDISPSSSSQSEPAQYEKPMNAAGNDEDVHTYATQLT